MQPDGGLARPRTSLHGQQFAERGPDDLVLFGLDGGDDVEHLARAGSLELGEQGVPTTQPSRRRLVPGAAEEIVGDGDHRPAVDHDLTPPDETQGVLGTRPIEGDGYRGPPVDHDRV